MSATGRPQQDAPKAKFAETMMNLALLDPPRWGWTAVGGVADVLPPHERARRRESRRAFLKGKKRKRGRPNQTSLKPPPPPSSQAAPGASSGEPNKVDLIAENNRQNESTSTKGNEQQQPIPGGGEESAAKVANNESQAEELKNSATENEGEHKSENGDRKSENGNLHTFGEEANASESIAEKSVSETISESVKSGGDMTKPPASVDIAMTNAAEAAPVGPAQPSTQTEANQPLEHDQGADVEKNSDSANVEPRKPNVYSNSDEKVLEVKALREDGSLDIYAYHRGREGMEPRDEVTGELLCDVPVTDTNWDFDEPKLSAQIKIEFPLSNDKDIPSSEIPMYEDTITWDLSDPETPTPMAFAVDVAENFGLTFGQTLELAQSVQLQLYEFVKEYCGYAVPVALSDGTGNERTHFPQPSYPYLYGDAFEDRSRPGPIPGTKYGITKHPSKSKSKSKGFAPPVGSSSRKQAPISDDRHSVLQEPEEEIEDKYVEEVKKRMIELSRKDITARAKGSPASPASSGSQVPPGLVELKINHVCHICHKRHDLVGQFPCGRTSHSYCQSHMENRLGVTVRSINDVVHLDVCPICSVTCACSRCGRRREALAKVLKRLCQEQGVEPGNVVFEDMFRCYTKPAEVAKVSKGGATVKRRDSIESTVSADTKRTEDTKNTTETTAPTKPAPPTKKAKTIRRNPIRWDGEKVNVAKADASEFPREIRGGVDVDPGTVTDYRTVFTAERSYVKETETKGSATSQTDVPTRSSVPLEASVVVEDGNVDYCHKCRKHGNLVCCDFCPRAFHEGCIEEGDGESRGKWECHVCRRENQDLPEYTITGNDSMPIICAAYSSLKATCDDDLTQLCVLSKLHELIQQLMQYDFGYIFCEPVDCKQVPGYRKIIKKPMDLGTIGKRLVNGHYGKFFEAQKSWDDVHLAVLKDIELVWHNCFTFNFEGSSIHRMAEVHRKRMVKMLERSINKDLSDNVKQNVHEYVVKCQRERGKFPASNDVPALAATHNRTKGNSCPATGHEITVKIQKGGVTKPVAVFDPDTGMIVKIYSTMKAAFLAAEYVLNRGHKSELSQVTDHTIKSLVHRSAQDPTATLFGYRWLELDKLRNRQVNFSKTAWDRNGAILNRTHIFEMSDGKCIYIFLSIEEALSSPKLPSGISIDELREKLSELPEGGESVPVSGMQWRRLKPTPPAEAPEKKEKSERKRDTGVSLAAFWRFGKENRPANIQTQLSPRAIIFKEDVIIRRILAGFDTLDAAIEDWQHACRSSPTVAEDEITEPNFHTYYLDGDRNVDGIVWKTVDKDTALHFDKIADGDPDCVAFAFKNGGAYHTSQGESANVTQSDAPSAGEVDNYNTVSESLENGHSNSRNECIGEAFTASKVVDATKTGETGALETHRNGLKRGRSEEEVLQPRKK